MKEITYCKDTYTITTANGQTRKFWERNLRLKDRLSEDGPQSGIPAAASRWNGRRSCRCHLCCARGNRWVYQAGSVDPPPCRGEWRVAVSWSKPTFEASCECSSLQYQLSSSYLEPSLPKLTPPWTIRNQVPAVRWKRRLEKSRFGSRKTWSRHSARLDVRDAEGARVDQGKAQVSETVMRVGLKPLLLGTYKVHWRAVSADTHAIEGSFSFQVGKQ